MSLILHLAGKPPELQTVVYIYGATQFFITANATLSAMLHAKGRVGGMSALSVATKVVWAVGVLWAMAAHAGLWAYAASYLASESVETVVLWWLARTHLGLGFRVDAAATKAMLLSSLPYYLNGLATTAYAKLDVTILDFYSGSSEVGYYGAATTIALLTLLMTPLIGWVLQPMFARAAARSREELYLQASNSLQLILTMAIPVSLLINLGADVWIRVVFGAAFAPAASALRVLALMFVLTYVAIIYATVLIMLERPWTLTIISFMGLVVNTTLNLIFVRFSTHIWGTGGGGAGCALAMFCNEIFVVVAMAVALRGGTLRRQNVDIIARSLVACAVVVVVHLLLKRFPYARIAVDAVVYFALVIAIGALRPREMIKAIQQAMRPASS
jgi:O-antigen/teichoic acid export membrane protein